MQPIFKDYFYFLYSLSQFFLDGFLLVFRSNSNPRYRLNLGDRTHTNGGDFANQTSDYQQGIAFDMLHAYQGMKVDHAFGESCLDLPLHFIRSTN